MIFSLPRPLVVALGCALLLMPSGAGARPQQTDGAAPLSNGTPRGETARIGPASHILPPSSYRFPVNQNFVYQVEWRLWDAGTATLGLTSDGAGVMRPSATADSSGVVSVLYPVHDRFQAVFDPRTFCSQSLTKHVEEGFHERETLISFNYGRRRSMLDETNLKNNQRKHQEMDIPGCVTDVISGIFYVASLPLQPKASYSFPLNDGGQTVDVTVQAEGRETITTPAGVFPTIRVSPQASSGPVKDKGRIWIWYSDDARRIPVQMRARMFWGTLTFRLLRIDKKTP
jgi:Protein of unknown function (DUF3108)